MIGSQFNTSGQINNLIPQNSGVNRVGGEWYKMETEWSSALEIGSNIKVDIKPNYIGDSVGSSIINVDYWIDSKAVCILIPNP